MENDPYAAKINRTEEKLHNTEDGLQRREKIRLLASDPYNRNSELDDLRETFVARGFFENFYQWRLQKKGRKLEEAKYYQKRQEAYFGQDSRPEVPSITHSLLTSRPLGELPQTAADNAKRVVAGPILEDEGLTWLGKKVKHAINLGKLAVDKDTDARAYLDEKSLIRATKVKLGDKPHRIAGNKVRKASEKFERSGMLSDAARKFKRARLVRRLKRHNECTGTNSQHREHKSEDSEEK